MIINSHERLGRPQIPDNPGIGPELVSIKFSIMADVEYIVLSGEASEGMDGGLSCLSFVLSSSFSFGAGSSASLVGPR